MEQNEIADLLGGLGGKPTTPAGDPAPAAEPTGTPPAANPDTPPAAGAGTPPAAAGEPNDPKPENRTIREMREAIRQKDAEAKSTKDTLDRIAKANGFDTHEKYLEHLDAEEVKKKAETNKVSPELQKELDQLKQQQQAYEAEKEKNAFVTRLMTFQNTTKLTNEQVLDFADKVQELGINLTNTTIPFDALYKLTNMDSIIEETKKATRAEVMAEIERANKGPNNPRTTGAGGAPEKTDMNALMAELEASFNKK